MEKRTIHDWNFCPGGFSPEKRVIGDCRRRSDRRHPGSAASLHSLWLGYSAGNCRGPAGEAGVSRRRRDVCSGCAAALLYCLFGGNRLLPGESPIAVFEGVSVGLRTVLRRRGGGFHAFRRSAAFRAALARSLQAQRSYPGTDGTHGGGRSTDFLQHQAVRPGKGFSRHPCAY